MLQQNQVKINDGQTIKILSFNTFLRPPPIKNNQDDYKNQRFQDIVQLISQYDIVCLQEVFQALNYRYEDLIIAAYQKQFYYFIASQPPQFYEGPIVDSGLVILSKYPIVGQIFKNYGFGVLSDSSSDKGFLYAKIKIKQTHLHLFNTHFQASYYKQDGDTTLFELSMITRLEQVKILRTNITNILKSHNYTSSDTILLAGDFNVDAIRQPITLKQDSHIKNGKQQKFDQYKQLKSILTAQQYGQSPTGHPNIIIDYMFQKYGKHLPTFGTEQTPVLTQKNQLLVPQRLDYILQIHQKDINKGHKKIKPIIQSFKVEQFKLENRPYTQLSDHYGVSICFRV